MNMKHYGESDRPRIDLSIPSTIEGFFKVYPEMHILSVDRLVEFYLHGHEDKENKNQEDKKPLVVTQEKILLAQKKAVQERVFLARQYQEALKVLPEKIRQKMPATLSEVSVEKDYSLPGRELTVEMLMHRIANLAEADYQVKKGEEKLLQELDAFSQVSPESNPVIKEITDEQLAAK